MQTNQTKHLSWIVSNGAVRRCLLQCFFQMHGCEIKKCRSAANVNKTLFPALFTQTILTYLCINFFVPNVCLLKCFVTLTRCFSLINCAFWDTWTIIMRSYDKWTEAKGTIIKLVSNNLLNSFVEHLSAHLNNLHHKSQIWSSSFIPALTFYFIFCFVLNLFVSAPTSLLWNEGCFCVSSLHPDVWVRIEANAPRSCVGRRCHRPAPSAYPVLSW